MIHIMYAHKKVSERGTTYFHASPDRKWVLLHGCPESEVVKLKVTERADQTLPTDRKEQVYMGWRKTGKTVPIMIQPCYLMFDMQFVAGSQVEVERGRGVIVCMDFEEIEEDADANKDRGVE